MKQRKLFLCLLLLLCLHMSVQAQEAMFIHSGQQCVALDIQNIGEVTINQDSLVADVSNYFYSAPADSITFGDFVTEDSYFPRQDNGEAAPMRAGWWGGTSDHLQTCYYHPNADDMPDIQLTVDDNRCTMAECIFPESFMEDTLSFSAPRKVGTKWRYVKGTLTGRHKFHLACYDNQPFMGHDVVEEDGPAESTADGTPGSMTRYLRVTLHDMFEGKTIADVRQALNYWYRPSAIRQLPAAPLFGISKGDYYEQRLPNDSIRVRLVLFTYGDSPVMVGGDTLTITFADEETARLQFEQIGIENDDSISCARSGDTIYIAESFQATLDEVRQWLVRFDLELRKPLFIREE